MTDSSSESDDSSNMEIEAENNIKFRLGIAKRLAAILVTSYVLKYVVKEK